MTTIFFQLLSSKIQSQSVRQSQCIILNYAFLIVNCSAISSIFSRGKPTTWAICSWDNRFMARRFLAFSIAFCRMPWVITLGNSLGDAIGKSLVVAFLVDVADEFFLVKFRQRVCQNLLLSQAAACSYRPFNCIVYGFPQFLLLS